MLEFNTWVSHHAYNWDCTNSVWLCDKSVAAIQFWDVNYRTCFVCWITISCDISSFSQAVKVDVQISFLIILENPKYFSPFISLVVWHVESQFDLRIGICLLGIIYDEFGCLSILVAILKCSDQVCFCGLLKALLLRCAPLQICAGFGSLSQTPDATCWERGSILSKDWEGWQ